MKLIRTAVSVLLLATLAACTAPSEEDPNEVLVFGATGRTGKHVVEHLLVQGYKVRVFVRNRQKAEELFGDRVIYADGIVQDPAAVTAATVGVSYVISALGSSGKDAANMPERIDYEGVMHISDAAAESGVKQLVLISSMAVTHEDHVLNRIANNVLIWKKKGEDHLRASGLAYTIVRPGGLTDKAGGEFQLVFEQGDIVKVVQIARDDVARVCVAALAHPEARFKTFEVFATKEPAKNNWQLMFAALEKG